MNALFGKTFDMLAGLLEYRDQRHQLIASNIANIDSPDYLPADLKFDAALDLAGSGSRQVELAKTDPRHLPREDVGQQDFEVVRSKQKTDVDAEMGRLAENHLMYNMTVEMLARKFRKISNLIQDAK
jgi:flagellar basal-body rod protein FlgB